MLFLPHWINHSIELDLKSFLENTKQDDSFYTGMLCTHCWGGPGWRGEKWKGGEGKGRGTPAIRTPLFSLRPSILLLSNCHLSRSSPVRIMCGLMTCKLYYLAFSMQIQSHLPKETTTAQNVQPRWSLTLGVLMRGQTTGYLIILLITVTTACS